MFKCVLEEEFLNRKNQPINYIGIYELDWIIDDNQLDCEGIIVSFEDRQYLIKSFARSEEDFEFSYFELTKEYKCRKILSSHKEPICFIRKEKEKESCPVLRFQIGARPILATADNGYLTIGISHWDINEKWLEFENNNILNDC